MVTLYDISKSEIPHKEFSSLSFRCYTNEDIVNLSVVEVTETKTFDNAGFPVRNGLYDPLFGPTDFRDQCECCGLRFAQCPGHFGHLKLNMPVFNPMLFPITFQTDDQKGKKIYEDNIMKARTTCPHCKYRAPTIRNDFGVTVLLDFAAAKARGLRGSAAVLEDEEEEEGLPKEETLAETSDLLAELEKPKVDTPSTLLSTGRARDSLALQLQQVRTGRVDKLAWRALEVRDHFRKLWQREHAHLKRLYPLFADEQLTRLACPMDVLFMDTVLVSPSKFRPIRNFAGQRFESSETVIYRRILEADQLLSMVKVSMKSNKEFVNVKEVLDTRVPGKTLNEKLYNAYVGLQQATNNIFDRDSVPSNRGNGEKGLKQILEKKEGLFRMNMMGKRVNYACRSVITPDPYLDVDEIGIPEVFAKKLTFPEPFCYFNAHRLRAQCENGPDLHPGANFTQVVGAPKQVLNENPADRVGQARNLKAATATGRSKQSLVYRHLERGDQMLMNRQPTLHRPSIMSHRVRILRGQKALRMNYAPCKAYNADFDGDEMNGHFIQSKMGQVEASEIVSVGRNFLVPKDGTPILGLIQDHVVSGVLMTIRGRFFNREDFMHLVLAAFGVPTARIRLPTPAMLKPRQLWSGKQVISTVLLNCIPDDLPRINLAGKAKTPLVCWKVPGHDPPAFTMSESEVVFRQGELLCGVLDKAHYGATQFGLIHCCFELYGPKVAVKIISCFSRLFTRYLQWNGFTLGVADILVTDEANKKRAAAIRKIRQSGPEATRKTFNLDENVSALRLKHAIATAYNNPRKDVSEVKMLDFNVKQICGKLTDQINEACVPGGLIRSFPDNALQMMIQSGAKGSMVNSIQISCALGQIELEGKRPPLSAVGRTLPSFRCFDPSPRAGGFVDQRFLTGINPQELFFHTMAGREGLIDTAVKTSRSGYLQRCIIKHLEGIVVAYDHTVRDNDNRVVQFRYGEDGLDVGKAGYLGPKQFPFLQHNQQCLAQAVRPARVRDADFQLHQARRHYRRIRKWKRRNGDPVRKLYRSGFLVYSAQNAGQPRELLVQRWRAMSADQRAEYEAQAGKRCPATMDEKFSIAHTLGALPEKILDSIENFAGTEDDDPFKSSLYWKAMHTLAEPGDTVGLVAAQSIGEPSTQMTLNTFHFAGRGEMNVTLGIPRLREILMTAGASIATPMVEVLIRPSATPADIDELKRVLTPVTLKDVLKAFSIEEKLVLRRGASARQYSVRFVLKRNKDREEWARHLSRAAILHSIERVVSKAIGDQLIRNYRDILELEVLQHHRMKQTNERILLKARPDAATEDLEETGAKKKEERRADDDSSDEEAEHGAEADAAQARLSRRHHDDGADYEGEEEEQRQLDPDDEDLAEDSEPDHADQPAVGDEMRIRSVIESHQQITSYEYDTKAQRWCTVVYELPLRTKTKLNVAGMVERVVEKAVVWKTPHIDKCVIREDQRNGRTVQVLQTQKINIEAMYRFAHVLDVNTLYSNDINMMLKHYGVEACTRVIRKEMNNVFSVYGIEVNPRHLSLVADHMTHIGTVQPFSRGAMIHNSSPLQKMTYETTLRFMRDAIVQGQTDQLRSPSARLITGQTVRSGTGFFDILNDPHYLIKPKQPRPLLDEPEPTDPAMET